MSSFTKNYLENFLMENINETEMNRGNISETKTTSEPFWKLFRGKFLLTFSLCAG